MEAFSRLFNSLDETNSTRLKVEALVRYLTDVDARNGAWALYFLMGNRLPRTVKTAELREWAAVESGCPLWLLEECYATVGDLAETLALLLPEPDPGVRKPPELADLVEYTLLPLRDQSQDAVRETICHQWRHLCGSERFVFNKLLTGGFRVGVQRTLVSRALAQIAKVPPPVMAHRLMGAWRPIPSAFEALLRPEDRDQPSPIQPYPFYLAYPLEEGQGLDPFLALGPVENWQIEWKWDGIRAQIIKRSGQLSVWSRGEELLTDRFPEIEEGLETLPDGTVLDGEILAWKNGQPLPFTLLQQRISRKSLSPRILRDAPVAFMVYDLLEWEGCDIRGRPLQIRRHLLQSLPLNSDRTLLSPVIEPVDWYELDRLRAQARERGVEGCMLKFRQGSYGVGRVKGEWWKWKVDPLTLDAVLIYAQSGHGRRAGLFTDYTFALWRGDQLVPVAKAYSGLTDAEFREVDQWIKQNTLERFGPVRSVPPELVFDIGFEGVNRSTRHKSGYALRFPRMKRWRRDKLPRDADSLELLETWLPPQS